MAAMANIVVKKHDNTTDITYTAVTPSSGDSSPAVWKAQSAGTAWAFQPELRLTTSSGAKGATRKAHVTFQFPRTVVNSVTTLTTVEQVLSGSFDFHFSKTAPQSVVDEAVAQLAHLLNSALMIDSVRTGVAPT